MAKIAFVDLVFNYPPNGGASTDLYGIMSGLKDDHDIRLFLPAHKKINISQDFDFHYELIETSFFGFNYKSYPDKLKKELTRYEPDFLFVADGWYLKPYIINNLSEFNPILRFYAYETLCLKSHGHFARLNKLCKKNYLQDPWASTFECKICSFLWILSNHNRVFLQEFLNAKVYLPGYARIVKDALKNAWKIIVYNNFTKSIVAKYNEDVIVIPSGVDIEKFRPFNKSGKNEKIKILAFGRYEHWFKGIKLLIETCKKLWEKRQDFILCITTDKEYNEPFIQKLGWIKHSELPAIINDSDICVIPSIWEEPFGISVVEAMSCGKAVLGSDAGGIPEIIEHERSGLIFKRDLNGDLAEKLERLMDDEKLRTNLGKSARKRIEENFSWDRVINKYYRSFIK